MKDVANVISFVNMKISCCSDFLVRNTTVQRLDNCAKLQYHGPFNIGGVGDVATISPGVFSVEIPLADAGIAVLTGQSLSK